MLSIAERMLSTMEPPRYPLYGLTYFTSTCQNSFIYLFSYCNTICKDNESTLNWKTKLSQVAGFASSSRAWILCAAIRDGRPLRYCKYGISVSNLQVNSTESAGLAGQKIFAGASGNAYLSAMHQESPRRSTNRAARSHGGKAMRMFNQKKSVS